MSATIPVTMVCHFCDYDYTKDDFAILVEGPGSKAKICAACIRKGLLHVTNKSNQPEPVQRCNICGKSTETGSYGQAPVICSDCLHATKKLLDQEMYEY